MTQLNGANADMAAKYSWQCKRPPEMGFPRFLLAYFLKINEPQRPFSSEILHKRHYDGGILPPRQGVGPRK